VTGNLTRHCGGEKVILGCIKLHLIVIDQLEPHIACVEQVKVATNRQRVVIALLQLCDATPYDGTRQGAMSS
jgi:hypothetical protein